MEAASRALTYWRNTRRMPFLLRLWCQGGMVAGPILLLFAIFPIADWTVNGRAMSYGEFWTSGAGASMATFVSLITIGAWGMAAKIPASRWALVLAPVLPLVFSPGPMVETTSLPSLIVAQGITAAIIYWCLFHIDAVRQYLNRGKPDNGQHTAA